MGILMLNGNNYTGGIQQVYGKSSGDIATFDDGGDNKPLKSLKVAINPVQASGTPSPSNPLPISGWTGANVTDCGKNLCPDKHYTRTPRENVIGTDTDNTFPFRLKGGLTYTFSLVTSVQTIIQLYIREKNQTRATPYNLTNGVATFTPSITGNYIFVLATALQDTPFSSFSNIMLEEGSQLTEYEPYNGTTYPITWSEAGEVFGGYIEFKDGEWKAYKTHYIETIDSSKVNQSTTIFTYVPFSYSMKSGNAMNGLCDKFATVSSSSEYGIRFGTNNQTIYLYGLMNNIPEIYDTASARAWFAANPTKIYYPLATPIQFTLDSPLPNIKTLLGNNNIWSDTGDITECVYQRDLNIVINQFDARITALEQALNSSGTRSLSLSKSVVKEEETNEEITEEPKEEEQNEDKR